MHCQDARQKVQPLMPTVDCLSKPIVANFYSCSSPKVGGPKMLGYTPPIQPLALITGRQVTPLAVCLIPPAISAYEGTGSYVGYGFQHSAQQLMER